MILPRNKPLVSVFTRELLDAESQSRLGGARVRHKTWDNLQEFGEILKHEPAVRDAIYK